LPPNSSFADSGDGTGRFNFSPDFNQAGTYFVQFLAKDSDDTTVIGQDSITLVVNDVNRKPVFTQGIISDRILTEGDSVFINLSTTDADGTIPILGFRAENAAFQPISLANVTIVDSGNGNGQFKFYPGYFQAGVYYIAFFAVDEVYNGDTTFFSPKPRITVNDVPLAPVVFDLPDTTIQEGDTLLLTVTAADPDSTIPNVTAFNLPTNATFAPFPTGGGGFFRYTPAFNHSGVYTVGFVASDGSLADTEQVIITVTESGNHAPLFVTVIPDSIIYVTNRLDSLQVVAEDPDSTIPSLSAASLPAFSSFDSTGPGKATFYYSPVDTQAGNIYHIPITVSDGSLQSVDTLKIVVKAFLRGDANRDLKITLGDVIYLVNYIFGTGPDPIPPEAGDANASGEITLGDIVYLVNYILKNGPPPPP
jgi:hypothetical protein